MILHSHQTAYQNFLDRKERLSMYELSKGDLSSHQDKSCVIFLIYSYTVDENFLCMRTACVPMHTCALVCAPMWRLEDYLNGTTTQSALPPSPFLLSIFNFFSRKGLSLAWRDLLVSVSPALGFKCGSPCRSSVKVGSADELGSSCLIFH